MQLLLEKTRILHQLLQKSAGQALDFNAIAGELSRMIESSVYIVGKNGKVLGKGETTSVRGGLFHPDELKDGQFSESSQQWLFGFTHTEVNLVPKDTGFYCILAPVFGSGERMGTVVYAREGQPYSPAETILAEYGASVAGMQILRNASERLETEARKKTVVQLALEVLSYSELEAVKYIFSEIEGSEGFLVASKLAEEYKLTRSVIVNALRKLESAGVIDARSLGMKGTYIKVLNDFLYEQLAQI
ncbi:MAG: GTP-sensing pleiotropic transcriptional regulator CodY [Peptococcaceae bacterium]|jgi:transcriptional pleiotropic repressor|nr:GTP-sensing pleiotropic transcriptional regulator CodY [Peptococcaceae bacterium]MDH7524791.1 GTP-sensing pleiotropic transcriptional regulator CodY [Peptococcaceae bacterium]